MKRCILDDSLTTGRISEQDILVSRDKDLSKEVSVTERHENGPTTILSIEPKPVVTRFTIRKDPQSIAIESNATIFCTHLPCDSSGKATDCIRAIDEIGCLEP